MKKIYEDLKKVFESKIAFRILIGIGIVIVALLIFSLGIIVGFHKVSFERDWGENYEHNFSPKPNGPIFNPNNFPNADGAIGKIIKITLPTIIVEDKNNTEKVILLKTDTQIQKMKTPVAGSDLKIDDFVVVIGSPNAQGQIEAKFIRVMPFGIPVAPTPQAPTK
jgi:hypothetical protein